MEAKAIAAPAECDSSRSFFDLLRQLGEAHAREIGALREQWALELVAVREQEFGEGPREKVRLQACAILPQLRSPIDLQTIDLQIEEVPLSEPAESTASQVASHAADDDGGPVAPVAPQTVTRRERLVDEPMVPRPNWLKAPEKRIVTSIVMDVDLSNRTTLNGTSIHESSTRCSTVISSPSSTWRLYWDMTSTLFIFYDTITVPFVFSFDVPSVMFLTVMNWITMFFWTSDMFLTFFVGYHHKGSLIMSPWRIARRYLLSWLFLDLVVNTGDWIGNVGSLTQSGKVEGEQNSAQATAQVARSAFRAMRIVRLVRILKLSRLVTVVQDNIESESSFLLFGIVKLLFFILAINHFIACFWFLLGRVMHETGSPSWVEVDNIVQRELGYKYTTALHWTLTQFTPSSMEVFPENTAERTMAVIILVFALVVFSSFVGSITSSMAQLRNLNADRDKQFWLLRRFLKQNEMPKLVSTRICKYLQYIWLKSYSKVQRSDVKVLAQLSEQLQDELKYHMLIPKCSGHLLFGHCSQHMEVPMRIICASGMDQKQLASGDVLFYANDWATHCYFFMQGNLVYKRPGIGEITTNVETRECISEASLWATWHHRGTTWAPGETEVIALSVEKFNAVMSTHEDTWSFFSMFAKNFVKVFEDHCTGSQLDPTDLIRISQFHMKVIRQVTAESISLEKTSSHLELAAINLCSEGPRLTRIRSSFSL